MATRAKKTKIRTTKASSRPASARRSTERAAQAKPSKKSATKGMVKPKKFPPVRTSTELPPRASKAVKTAADALWGVGVTPHVLLKELQQVLLLRCLQEAQGNYASAAKLFGPSRQSVQQYANSSLRDERWAPYQQNQRST